MIEIVKELKIEVSKPNIFQAVVAKQFDMNTRFIKATLVDGADIITIPIGPTIKVIINAERPDGKSKGFDGSVNDDGTVTVPLHSWMLELEGTVVCDISIIDIATDDNKKLTTTAFTLLVEKASYGGDDVTNDPQYDVLISLLETCQEANTVAQEALNKSQEADAKYEACVEATEDAIDATETANHAANQAFAVRRELEEGGFVESLKEKNKGDKLTFWVGTNEEYETLTEKEKNCMYLTTDDKPLNAVLFEGEKEVHIDGDSVFYEIPNLKDYSLIAVDFKYFYLDIQSEPREQYSTVLLHKREIEDANGKGFHFMGQFMRLISPEEKQPASLFSVVDMDIFNEPYLDEDGEIITDNEWPINFTYSFDYYEYCDGKYIIQKVVGLL